MTVIEADGVFQGGGIKGLAIAGALLEFAENDRLSVSRWRSVAGTSAGAIIAAYLAAGKSATELATLLHNAPFASFQDSGPGGKLIGGAVGLVRRRGLARGDVFLRWFDNELGGMTFGDVRSESSNGEKPPHEFRLRMIAADVTHHRLLVLPDDLRGYKREKDGAKIDPNDFPVAEAARMSLSVPYFFSPVQLIDGRTNNPATIIDGGTLSNFPVWLFDAVGRDPTRPTFGLRLVGGRAVGSGLRSFVRMLGWPAALAVDISQTQSGAWDQRFVTASTRVRTCTVDAGTVGTTDFGLSAPRRADLINGGRRAAASFLNTFNLDDYRNSFGRALTT
jgi:NTE family protein